MSVLELFKIGIGPSSSHTVGPMLAAARFARALEAAGNLESAVATEVDLYGSLAATGRGHGTDRAVVLGLEGEHPATVDASAALECLERVRATGAVWLAGRKPVRFHLDHDIRFHYGKALPEHPNGLVIRAIDSSERVLLECTYFSIGGGFIVERAETGSAAEGHEEGPSTDDVPLPFATGGELLSLCDQYDRSIASIVLENEENWRPRDNTRVELLRIWRTMRESIERGITSDGVLPGGLGVRRRAPALARELEKREANLNAAMDWACVAAMAVNEENAAGGRVVTAPTNGAAGILPGTLHYCYRTIKDFGDADVVRFLLTAGAIGMIVKENAGISGAELGCQAEVGSACAMAAAGLAAVMGGSASQIECAAEIALEHNLGLTCDPVGGLVQIPCIERNGLGCLKAIGAARLALAESGEHIVSLDAAIRTMRDTGRDMKSKYKETSRGGLAVNVVEC